MTIKENNPSVPSDNGESVYKFNYVKLPNGNYERQLNPRWPAALAAHEARWLADIRARMEQRRAARNQ